MVGLLVVDEYQKNQHISLYKIEKLEINLFTDYGHI